MGDLVKGILTNADIYDNSIYYHKLERCYAAQVTNVSMYDAIRYLETFNFTIL